MKRAIETAIQQGQLRKYIQVAPPVVTSAESRPNTGTTLPYVINVISDNSDKLLFPPQKWIRFAQVNLVDSRPLVISLHIETYFVRRILVDTSNSANVLYYDTWKKMCLDDKLLQPYSVPIVDFSGTTTHPSDTANLLIRW